ncbi:Metallo-hydrolase/oxidoreductase [Auriculariales sp. MPI-PUGE-AT-0066]|nr:Metallo-hydrolase/oxidoreductase [Auriculariales sp. MPI-PUGE-AT-0066]
MAALSALGITFLGTASAQPSSSRNHSSLALRLGADVWLFDCGEATQHQVQRSTDVRMGRIRKVFITHTHGDHIFGLAPLMASAMNGAGGTTDGPDERLEVDETLLPTFEIYGPLGTRAYVRSALRFTHTLLQGRYIVHELRFAADPVGDPADAVPTHHCELAGGRNITQAIDGTWRDIYQDNLVRVSAAPILHSVPCLGYVVDELPVPGKIEPKLYTPHIMRNKDALVASGLDKPMSLLARIQAGESIMLPDGTELAPPSRRPGRKLAILGDTHDPSPIADLAQGADVLIHEATNAFLPADETEQNVELRAKSHGHSTPQMAGAFATRIGAKMLLLNHFSARYPSDDEGNAEAKVVMEAIRDLARSQFIGQVICARDLMSLTVPRAFDS